jgi:predicted secreted Zn-dependent protease
MHARSLRVTLVAVVVTLLAIGLDAAERVTRYNITGSSAQELREAMNRARPTGADGRPHDGLTVWHLRWQFTSTSRNGLCAVSSYEIRLDVETTLPNWVNEREAPAELVARWRNFMTALEAHEAGHKVIAGQAAAAVRDAIVSLGPQLGCDLLREELNRAANKVLDQHRQRNVQYDTDTDHGRTQGARFP